MKILLIITGCNGQNQIHLSQVWWAWWRPSCISLAPPTSQEIRDRHPDRFRHDLHHSHRRTRDDPVWCSCTSPVVIFLVKTKFALKFTLKFAIWQLLVNDIKSTFVYSSFKLSNQGHIYFAYVYFPTAGLKKFFLLSEGRFGLQRLVQIAITALGINFFL